MKNYSRNLFYDQDMAKSTSLKDFEIRRLRKQWISVDLIAS